MRPIEELQHEINEKLKEQQSNKRSTSILMKLVRHTEKRIGL